ncbi:Pca regulon regulatory protein [Pigmentiphaga humi]|uniref:Pca regulon regulatory protein n=1 Tax=Pigmentiphaga humi TaxID=2478468 RepID=A0A3P4B1P2_9BURK|nr:IclR family transcriptional regulator C-terminal domain-containing protein [Pigmentiphaga humi]VCU69568.1 Pca regulon regulatory protein [Pigmentiphaga humi]
MAHDESRDAAPRPARSRDRMGGLVKGLQLIEAFDSAHGRMTPTEAALRVGISPAAARRCLLTLCELGYAQTDGKQYWLSHGALRVAYAYAASTRLPRMLQPALDALTERTRESGSLCVLDGNRVAIAARATARRTMRVGLVMGSHLPLFCSSGGRVLMAALRDDEWRALVASAAMEPYTRHTVVTLDGLAGLIDECRRIGYAACDEEIELGVRSIAIPIYNKQGATVAAMSVSTRAERMTTAEMVNQLLPTMLRNQEWARSRI